MRKILLVSIGFLFAFSIVYSQSNPLDKKMEKAYSLIEKDKIDDAEKYMVKLLSENPDYGPGWDYLCKIRYKQYTQSKSLDNIFGGDIVVTTKDEKGKDIKNNNDSLGKNLMKMLNDIKPSKIAYDKYLYTLRQATLLSNDAYYSSQVLRTNFIDEETDTAVSRKALKYFNDAESEFEKKNYNDAAKLYKRAIGEQPDFYKAALYMGDCFYYLGNYIEAINSFKKAVEKFPNALEPRKYLIDAYAKEKLYSEALTEVFSAMAVYPDQSIAFAKMDDALYLNNKTLDIKWIPRGTFPNKIISDSSRLNKYQPSADELICKSPWTFYKNSFSSIQTFCNEKGIVEKSNTLTKSGYMEVYGWEEMLKNSQDPLLDEARRMQKDGFLDCYVLVTCFHFDFYDQYIDFVGKNKSRITEYYTKYLLTAK
jgi:tetratricopeptide (TPR) repeat protein